MSHKKAIIFKINQITLITSLHITKIRNTKYNFVGVYPYSSLMVSHYTLV